MWYAFWDVDQDGDAAFEHRLDSVVREIGDRGKLMLPEAVPPFTSRLQHRHRHRHQLPLPLQPLWLWLQPL